MDLQVPDWLNGEFLTQCMQHKEQDDSVEAVQWKVSAAAPGGGGYGSIVFRVQLEYCHPKSAAIQTASLIVKSELTDSVGDCFDAGKICEPIFYKTFLQEVNKLIDTSFAPKSFFSPLPSVIVLEDLTERGFKVADRKKFLDVDHCRLFVAAAATMHATSVVVFHKHPTILESIRAEKMYSNDLKNKIMSNNMARISLQCLADCTERIDRFNKYSSLIREASANLWSMLVEAHKPRGGLNTINQGDPWTTNMMFRYDDQGTVREVKLLDFQALRHGSPVNDLVFFIWSSANHEVRRHHQDELYQLYLDTLNTKLQDLGCLERLTYKQLMDDVKRLIPQMLHKAGVWHPFLVSPVMLDIALYLGNRSDQEMKENFMQYYNEDYCQHHLPKLLEDLEIAGAFDFLRHYNNK